MRAVNKFFSIFSSVITFIFGTVFLTVGIIMFKNTKDSEYIDVEAIVIDSYYDVFDESYETEFTYEIDSVSYSGSLNTSKRYNVGDSFQIKCDIDNPNSYSNGNPRVFPYVFIGVGTVILIFFIVNIIRTISYRRKEPINDSNNDDYLYNYSVNDNPSDMEDYVFYYDKKERASLLKNASGEVIIKAVLVKNKLFKPSIFDFKNLETGFKKTRKVGVTVSTNIRNRRNRGIETDFGVYSSFKLDGENVWDILERMGYLIEATLDGITPIYKIKRNGEVIGNVRTEGYNFLTGKDKTLGDIPINGIFSVNCDKDDLDNVFLILFTLSRVNLFSMN